MSTDIAPAGEIDIQRVMGEALPDVEDPEIVQRAIAERILSADSIAELFPELKTVATRDMVGKRIAVRDCRIMRSDIEGARGTYLLIDAADLETGELVTLNTGAVQIMATCLGALRRKELPIEVEVAEAASAKPGRSAPLCLRPVGKTLAAVEKARSK